MQPARPSGLTMISLAAPAAPMAALSIPLIIYLPEFFSNALGINLAVVGLMFTVVRLADLALDPLIGGLMDRTATRFGQFRPWLVLGVPVVLAGTVMMFMAERGASPLRLSIGLALAYMGYSIVNLAQMGLGTELTSDYRQRSRVFAWWQVFNGLGLVLVLLLPVLLPLAVGAGKAQDSGFTVRTMGWFVLVSLPFTALLCVARVPESATVRTPHVASLADYRSLLGLSSTRLLLLAQILIGLAGGIAAAVFIFFFTMIKHLPRDYIGVQFVILSISSMCSAVLWSWLSNRIGKHNALIVGCLGYSAYLMVLFAMPAGQLVIFYAVAVLGGVAAGSLDMLPRAMMADVSDQDRLASGHDRLGMLFALLTVTIKLGQAVSIGIVYFLLDLIGFNATTSAVNPPAALAGVTALFTLVPISLYVLAAHCMRRYRLTPELHREIVAKLGEAA
jgi:GPH family glycoside/pentoside/hexuronide:cation symporter